MRDAETSRVTETSGVSVAVMIDVSSDASDAPIASTPGTVIY